MISEVCSTSLTNLALHSSCAVPFDAVELPVNYLLMSTVIELKGVLPERKYGRSDLGICRCAHVQKSTIKFSKLAPDETRVPLVARFLRTTICAK
jgi:hypothetical protein